MKRFFTTLSVVAIFFATACTKDIEPSSEIHASFSDVISHFKNSRSGEKLTEVYAIGEDNNVPTKTIRNDNGSVYWQKGDKICVLPFGSTAPGEFTATATDNSSWTSFSGEMTIRTVIGGSETSGETSWNYALYPYNNNVTRASDSVTATVPAEQTAVAGSFDPLSFVTVARSESFNFAFYNLCGGIKFSLKNEGIKSITIEGNNGEVLAGKINIKIDENDHPYASEIIEGETKITISAQDGTTFKTGEWYYISTLPVNLSNGFSLTFNKANAVGTRVTYASNTIKRSNFLRFTEWDSIVEFEEFKSEFAQAFFASDRHANSKNNNQNIIGPILTYMKNTLKADISHAFLVGDMVGSGNPGSSTYSPYYNTSEIKKEVTNVYKDAIVDISYGNHDAGFNDDAGIMNSTCTAIDCDAYLVYTVPQPYMMEAEESKCGAPEFKAWARQQDPSKPILVLSHMPLHVQRGDNLGASHWHRAMNEIATGSAYGTSAERNVLFITGHNHSQDNGTEFTYLVGSTINIQGTSSGSSYYDWNTGAWVNNSNNLNNATIYYDYWVAGYLNDRKNGTLMTIDNDNINLARYSASGPATKQGNDGSHNVTIKRIK